MATLQTKKTTTSVAALINNIADPQQRQDAQTLITIMEQLTKAKATVWGGSIIGFGDQHFISKSQPSV